MAPAKSTAVEDFQAGSRWTDEIARLALPVLLWCAQKGLYITYGQLDAELVRRHGIKSQARKTLYGKPAGKIGDVLEKLSREWEEDIPPINAIIVKDKKFLPSYGVDYYLKQYLSGSGKKKLTSANRDELAKEVMQAVFDYSNWRQVSEHFGFKKLSPATVVAPPEKIKKKFKLPSKLSFPGGESEAHKELKQWVSDNPKLLRKYGAFRKGAIEYQLLSGDEVDVLFMNDDATVAVEVKAFKAPDYELGRGIFQCVKYRATLRAMQLVEGEPPNAQSVLVTQKKLPEELAQIAKRLRVECYVVKP